MEAGNTYLRNFLSVIFAFIAVQGVARTIRLI